MSQPQYLHVYGIKNDIEMEKLLQVFADFEVPHTFYDYRDYPPTDEQLAKWAEHMGQEFPVNGRSTLWKKSERMFLRLDATGRMEWLRKHYHVLERPIIEDQDFNVVAMGSRPERILRDLCNIRL